MENAGSYEFDAEVEFPSIPQEKIPEDSHALRRILAGQRGLRQLYDDLDKQIKGETHCLAMLLRRDWERQSEGLLESGLSALRSVENDGGSSDEGGNDEGGNDRGGGGSEVNGDMLPLPGQILKIAKSLQKSTPAEALVVISAFASKALLCYQMVPWVSNAKEVFKHFKACVEAEDRHLAVIQMFQELLGPLKAE